MNHASMYGEIASDPAFLELQKRRSRFNWTLTAITLTVYYGYILVIAFAPAVLAVPLSDDSVITWGIPVGLSIIVLSLALTGLYVERTNREFDPALHAIIGAATERATRAAAADD